MSMDKPPLRILAGVRILSFTQFLLGPAGVQYLADLGADVIKIEPPGSGAWERTWAGGDTFLNGVSAFFLLSHRNTRSVALNLKHPDGLTTARRLVAGADVLVQNFRPGVMDRLGLGYAVAQEINPRLVYVSASGYGADSPYRDLPGQDLLIQAISGITSITGRASELPTASGAPVVDQHGAALLAMGILAALFHRERTGEGQHVEITMLQSALDLQLEPITYFLNGGFISRPNEPIGSGFHQAPYGIYQTRDGYLALSLNPIRKLRLALGGVPELEPYEPADCLLPKRDEIYRLVAPILQTRTTGEWLEILRAAGVWCAPANDYAQTFADPGVQYLDPLLEIDHPRAGSVRLLKHPIRYSVGEPSLNRLPPEVGADTVEVLREIGYADEEIERLERDGVIGIGNGLAEE